MEGLAGDRRGVSLLQKPDKWNGEDTRLHHQDDSYGWTFGSLINYECHALSKYLNFISTAERC